MPKEQKFDKRKLDAPVDKQYVFIGKVEIEALIVGLITGLIYGGLNLPIPAPPVLGGNLAILFTFVGLIIVGLARHEVAFGHPPASGGKYSRTEHSED